MATYIPFQPVIFDESLDECLLNTSGYSMPVQSGDNTQFQFLIDACSSAPNIVDNSSFSSSSSWLLGTNWTIASHRATHTQGVGGVLQQLFNLNNSGLYKAIITVTITSGTLSVTLGGSLIATITTSGTYEIFKNQTFGSTSGIIFSASTDCQCSVDYVSVLLIMKSMKVVIYNLDGTQAAILDNSDGYFNFNKQYWTTTIDWDALGLSYGCYYIGVADDCLNTCSQLYIADQVFYDSDFWTKNLATSTLTLLNNYWLYEGTGGGSSAVLTSINDVCAGKSYTITYTLAGHAGDAVFQLDLGGTTGTVRNANGTYTETIVSGGTSFNLTFASTVNPSNFWITDLSVKVIDSQLTTDYVSNKFVYSADTNCTKVISAVCNENSFGMGFVNTGFIPRVRVESKLILSGYPQERIKTKTSQGLKRVDFFSGDKNWRLRILRQPEHVMDFLALLIGFDHWYIDSVEYFAAEDEFAEPKPNKFFNVYDVDIECQKKTLLLQNKNCSDNIEVGSLTAQDVEIASGGKLTTSTGLQVTLSSKQ